MWHDSPASRRLGIRYPIVQGPFGGGLSSPALAAAVSNAGGLGSYGALGLPPARITEVIAEIRALTSSPFAVNLWVSTDDPGAASVTREQYEAALRPLAPLFAELGVDPPGFPLREWERFDAQVRALLDARPPVFSFIFGIPPAAVLQECSARGIVTIGTVTTPDEAIAAERAGVDIVVATGFEAGGHRASFLRSAEASLTGTFALVPQVADAVDIPVIAAGGIADGRGIAAALTLGADGVQIGTAFLACEESNAPAVHREALLDASQARLTGLSRAFTGRLARGLRNTLFERLDSEAADSSAGDLRMEDSRAGDTRAGDARAGDARAGDARAGGSQAGGSQTAKSQVAKAQVAKAQVAPRLPYPLQGQLVSGLREAAIRQGRGDLLALWAGQATPLLRHRRAADLFAALVADTEQRLAGTSRSR